ncbi:MAG: glycoside hydrolase, partial [Candidatus Eremiobacteraeota bacterium]|nr:glycoside hydrolase [Candidatus Eremiobacteraeota bacterium]
MSRQRLDDGRPYIYRTHDGGRSWQPITSGIPPNEPVNTVREDPQRRGLLFAGTERTVYVSFDDGGHWQSLQNDLPPTSIRDLVVHGDDLVVGTHGRSFWILDDIEPLRELQPRGPRVALANSRLFAPARAYRVRRDTNTDTPLPPDEPLGENPPDGAILDYSLGPQTTGPVSLAIFDAKGRRIRAFSSDDPPQTIAADIDVPTYWVRPSRIPSALPGMHRFVWDMREAAPAAFEHDYPISAIVHDTPRTPEGVLVQPGTYSVRLTAGGRSYMRPLHIVMDPRVTAPAAAIARQYALASRISAAMNRSFELALRSKNKDPRSAARYRRLNGELARMLDLVEAADAEPTA